MNVDQLFAEGAAAYDANDFTVALAKLLPLAQSGHAAAQYVLALMHRWGNGVDQSATLTLALLKAAADHGHAKAGLDLYFLLDPACVSFPAGMQLIEKDPIASRHYLEIASKRIKESAAAGDTKAMADLGFLFQYGYGVKPDGAEAIRWYSSAFDGGEYSAANALCLVYYEGDVRVRDQAKAMAWYLRTKELGCRFVRISEFEPPIAPKSKLGG